MKATSPPSEETRPRLTTAARTVPVKARSPPFRKSASSTSRVEAMKSPPVSTTPSGPTMTPFGFTSSTEPVAVSVPSIAETCPPVTRLSVAPVPFSICTRLPAPIEKLSKCRIALALD